MTLRITSPAFEPHAEIPARFTCEGADVSPPLAWSDVPAGTRSLALVVDDPDAPDPRAPKTVWVHWVLYDIPADASSIAEGQKPHGAREGSNDWNTPGWRGPCPPIGRHRYVHHLYALDTVLPDLHRPDARALRRAIEGHVLAEASLVGTYAKSGR